MSAEPTPRERALAIQLDAELVRLSAGAGTLQQAATASISLIETRLAEYRAELAAPALDLSALSPREREVVDHLVGGTRLSAIAKTFEISQHTVRNHMKHVFRKLGVHNQIELVARVGGRHG